MNEIELSEVIVNLRKELLKAQVKGANEGLKFKVEDIEVELQIATSKKGESDVKFWVVNFGGEIASSATHKIKLKLKPEDNGEEFKLGDQLETKPK